MPRARGGNRVVPAYGALAEAYDILHRRKPYLEEARLVQELARKYARRPLRSLLDVACGSGRHLEGFSRWFATAGVDASRTMLARARARAPQARLRLGRMDSFDLATQYDVVTCLFSAIAYARSPAELRRILRALARHTTPGGVVVVEPFIPPNKFRLGQVHFRVARASGTTVARMDAARARDGRAIFDFHFLVGRKGRVRHLVEVHDCGLFDDRTMRTAFRQAGLAVRYVRGGLSSHRGLYVGLKPATGRPARAGGVTAGRSRRPGTR